MPIKPKDHIFHLLCDLHTAIDAASTAVTAIAEHQDARIDELDDRLSRIESLFSVPTAKHLSN